MSSSWVRAALLLIIISYRADGFVEFEVDRCIFSSSELKDIQFIRSSFYEKVEFTRFDSSVGKFVGFTEYGVKNAEFWNNDTGFLNTIRAQRETYCQHNIGIEYSHILDKSVPPSVRLSSTTPPAGHLSMLVCSVYDFFPKKIRVSWTRDGSEITTGVTSTEELADGDWYYQVHSHLEYSPRSGEKIACVVEHASLDKPKITEWDPSMSESDRNKVAIGASGLILGLVLSLAGFIYYKRKARGRILVPSN